MGLTCTPTALQGVFILEPDAWSDPRGVFFESWHRDRYAALGLSDAFVQDNVSRSVQGTLRGLHVQEPYGQGKLVQVLSGEVFDVALDVRVGSPTFGRWIGERLSEENRRQMYIPAGFAHGFYVLSAWALLTYKCTEFYHPEAEMSIAWNDPAAAIAWPITTAPLLSKKDADAPALASIAAARLPKWPA